MYAGHKEAQSNRKRERDKEEEREIKKRREDVSF